MKISPPGAGNGWGRTVNGFETPPHNFTEAASPLSSRKHGVSKAGVLNSLYKTQQLQPYNSEVTQLPPGSTYFADAARVLDFNMTKSQCRIECFSPFDYDQYRMPPTASHSAAYPSTVYAPVVSRTAVDEPAPLDLNPYTFRADQIGPNHGIPNLGYLYMLAPGDWEIGQEPFNRKMCQTLYHEARNRAQQELENEATVDDSLSEEQKAMENEKRNKKWQRQLKLDQLLLAERIAIYESFYLQKEARQQMNSATQLQHNNIACGGAQSEGAYQGSYRPDEQRPVSQYLIDPALQINSNPSGNSRAAGQPSSMISAGYFQGTHHGVHQDTTPGNSSSAQLSAGYVCQYEGGRPHPPAYVADSRHMFPMNYDVAPSRVPQLPAGCCPAERPLTPPNEYDIKLAKYGGPARKLTNEELTAIFHEFSPGEQDIMRTTMMLNLQPMAAPPAYAFPPDSTATPVNAPKSRAPRKRAEKKKVWYDNKLAKEVLPTSEISLEALAAGERYAAEAAARAEEAKTTKAAAKKASRKKRNRKPTDMTTSIKVSDEMIGVLHRLNCPDPQGVYIQKGYGPAPTTASQMAPAVTPFAQNQDAHSQPTTPETSRSTAVSSRSELDNIEEEDECLSTEHGGHHDDATDSATPGKDGIAGGLKRKTETPSNLMKRVRLAKPKSELKSE